MLKKTGFLFLFISCIHIGFSQENFSKTVKLALRDAGNKLLLYHNDSTSLVLPIVKLDENKYVLAFESELTIEPDSLVNTVTKSLETANLPGNYIVEVIDCNTEEVVYSFGIKGNKEENIIPCIGRNLPLNCYKIEVVFTRKNPFAITYTGFIILFIVLIVLACFFIINKKNNAKKDNNYILLGNYKFYQGQNKLVKERLVIKLTPKESHIMKILSENQNEIVKREQLIKEVWEDNGVIVGRSLDAFVSKIRKKFENDSSINIVNIHGVGYKLEVAD